ncbi:MAG TPA: class I SAM-dependent methyltransferase, partial [Mucilaginibacter sp.]|nr:class I SAM-dependent methyltransferase [Mucilaginibacter sp.]
ISKILDVGCGSVNFGQTLKKAGNYEVWGIEPDPKSAREADGKLDKVINDLFTDELPEFKDQKFDLISFNDVLEHLVDPAEAICCCKKLLKKQGYILASIPNVRWYPVVLSLLRYRDFKYLEAGVMDKTHLRFFTKKSMIRLFEESGYEVLIIEGINKSKFKKFNVLNFLLFNSQEDMKYPQFAMLCRLKNDPNNN